MVQVRDGKILNCGQRIRNEKQDRDLGEKSEAEFKESIGNEGKGQGD